jgi:hypothetical protein
VDLTGIVELIHGSALSEWLRSSLKAMPIVEAIHVMALATVFGTIFIVDLRLLGYPNIQRSFRRLHHELLLDIGRVRHRRGDRRAAFWSTRSPAS